MIRIVKPAAPAVLLEKGGAARRKMEAAHGRGSRKFEFDASIYAAKPVKAALRKSQHDKCAFCESFFAHVGHGDVEHFRPKAGYKQKEGGRLTRPGYYWLAYEWNNLFYSCELCNQCFKRNLFPLKDGRRRARSHKYDLEKEEPLLVDPARVDPALYVTFRGEICHAVEGCREGDVTIQVLGLNREKLLDVRRDCLEALEALVEVCDRLRAAIAAPPAPDLVEKLHRFEARLQARMEPTSAYAAMARAFLNSRRSLT